VGYVWDETNPYVKKHKTSIQTLAKVVLIEKKKKLILESQKKLLHNFLI